MKLLPEMKPFVGDVMTYLYDGGTYEQLRVCSVYAFHLFLDGPGKMEIDGKLYPIERRTLIFLRPGQPHAFHISPAEPLAAYNLYCDLWNRETPVSLNRTFVYAPEPLVLDRKASEEDCPELDQLPCMFSLQAYPQLYEGFVMIAKMFSDTKVYRHEAASSCLYAWLLAWFNAIHAHQPSDYRIVRLLEHINTYPERSESVAEWANFCGLKRTYFHELFLRETGLTPKVYRHELLMKRAANLLLESEMSISLIAEKLGYTSIHPFSRHFSSYFGIAPTKYRQTPER